MKDKDTSGAESAKPIDSFEGADAVQDPPTTRKRVRPAAGGSYMADRETGEILLLDRTKTD